MKDKKYKRLVTELASLIEKFEEFDKIREDNEFDLTWRLSQLYESVLQDDEQKFIDIAGMQGHLMTTEEKQALAKKEAEQEAKREKAQESGSGQLSEIMNHQKKNTDKRWVKDLYRRSIKRCHPDTIKVADDDYKEELTTLYKSITKAYEDLNLDILMVDAYKLFIKPKEIKDDQLEILEEALKDYNQKINKVMASNGYVWSAFNDKMKEDFLVNLMKQRGVRFVDKSKVREVIKRKVSGRKMGQKPKNRLRERVKNKK